MTMQFHEQVDYDLWSAANLCLVVFLRSLFLTS